MTKEGKTGLVYRGPFIFRQGSGGVRELEGVECPEGKLTAEKAYIYIKDHLGSVVAVVDGASSEVVESSELIIRTLEQGSIRLLSADGLPRTR